MTTSKILPAGSVVGRFRVERLVERGSRAEVYLATERDSAQHIALKILDATRIIDPPDESTFLTNALNLSAVKGEGCSSHPDRRTGVSCLT